MFNHDESAGWYYRNDGETLGPISTQELRGYLRSGRIQPRQAVWQRRSLCSFFLPAETAVQDIDGHGNQVTQIGQDTWRGWN